jgi:hypothetical protein
VKQLKKLIFFGLISIAVFVFLFRKISIADIVNGFKAVDLRFSFIAFSLYIVANIFRAWRFNLILGKQIGFKIFLNIVFLQNFFSMLLPFRLGELSYVRMVHKNGINIGYNIASLLGARIFDLLSIVTIFTIALLVSYQNIPNSADLFLFLGSLMFLGVLFLVIFVFYSQKIVNFSEKILKKLSVYSRKITQYFIEKSKEIAEGFLNFRKERKLVKVAAQSFIIWILIYLSGFFLIKGAGIELDFWQSFFVYGFPSLVGIVPVFILGGLGFYEGSIILGLMFFGINKEIATTTSLILHVQELLFVIVLAGASFIIKKR